MQNVLHRPYGRLAHPSPLPLIVHACALCLVVLSPRIANNNNRYLIRLFGPTQPCTREAGACPCTRGSEVADEP